MDSVVTFRASRKKALLLLCVSVCLVVLGVWSLGEKPLVGWAIVFLFVLCAGASLMMMLPNAVYLRLDEEGFERHTLLGTRKIKWADVEGFRIGSIHGAKMIAIIYSREYKNEKVGRAFTKSLSGMEDVIGGYDATLEDVLNSLNSWRVRFGRKGI
jgi:hypothetical protein